MSTCLETCDSRRGIDGQLIVEIKNERERD